MSTDLLKTSVSSRTFRLLKALLFSFSVFLQGFKRCSGLLRHFVRRWLTNIVWTCCLNASIVELEILMSLNIPSILEVNWQPHSACREGKIENSQLEGNARGLVLHKWTCTWRSTYLQFWDHVFLQVVWDSLVAEQPAAQVLLVEPFKDILLLQEPKQHHGPIENWLNFLFC